MTAKTRTVIVALSMTLAGCTGETADGATRSPPMGSLVGTDWTLRAFGTTNGDSAALASGEITLTFGRDSAFAGSAGCNRYFGRYDRSGRDSLVLGQVGSTMMACPEPAMEQEVRYLTALGKISKFAVTGDTLFLSDDVGPGLSFVRVSTTP